MHCVKHTMQLDYPNEQGTTLRERLTQVFESTGVLDERLQEPEVPAQGAHLLTWFWELRNAVGGSGFGPAPISFSEINAWSELTETYPSPWEISLIRKMDMEYINFYAEEETRKKRNIESKQLGK